jgi:hypothetical protein
VSPKTGAFTHNDTSGAVVSDEAGAPRFAFSIGFVLVLAVILIYVAANIGVVKYYWTSAHKEFSWLPHFVFPLGTSVILIYSLYASFVPVPASPNNWSPAVAGIWLLLGIFILCLDEAKYSKPRSR